ncbi:WXG100 family type VII secretion target [Micromonospora azadirachtae]|uniref:WXG100 family type VII secretion target n=1 Tax=Micromonospora azadirachtae TaxID=1970735 RepID=A0ABW2ZX76_9ACTN
MTHPPSPETVRVAISELRSDGIKWRDAADQLRATAEVARTLHLGPFEFSAPADWVGLSQVYQELHARMTELLNDGVTALDAMGNALVAAADGYEEEDIQNMHRIRGVW